MHVQRRIAKNLLSAGLLALTAAVLAPSLAWSQLPVVPGPTTIPTTDWMDFTLIAEDRLDIGANLNIAGNFATWGSGGTLELAQDTFQLDGDPASFVAADTLNLAAQASVENAYTNQITGNPTGMVRGLTQATSFPLPLTLPTFPTAAVCDTCSLSAADVVVQPSQTMTLNPGCYGELFARQNATVFLAPGSYTFRELDLQKFSSLTATGPVQIYVRERIQTEENNFLGAMSGQVLDYQVWIGAKKSCVPGDNPVNSAIGAFSIAIGTFVAPEDDDFNFNKGVILLGTTVAKEIDVRGSHDNRPPTPTPTPIPTQTAPPTPTPTPTSTPSINNTPTPTPNGPTPTPNGPTPTPNGPTPTPNGPTPTPNSPTPTPNSPTPTPNSPTPTPNGPTPTPAVTPTPNFPTPTPTQPFNPPTPTPTSRLLPTPTPTQPFTPPTPTATVVPRKHPWGKKSGLIDSLFPTRTGPRVNPSMRRPLAVRR